MKRHVGFLLILLAGAAGCAGLRTNKETRAGWTAPISALGIGSGVADFSAPRDWRVHVVANAPGAASAPVTPEVTLADLKGPGCVLSLKAGNPSGTLSVAVDDAPPFQIDFANLFDGYVPPFTAPLAGSDASGSYSYVPIPFAKHCVISVHGATVSPVFQITYAEFRPDTPVIPFTIALAGPDKTYFAQWNREFATASQVRRVMRRVEKFHGTSTQIYPQMRRHLYTLQGAGVITELEMTVGAKDPDILHKVWLEMKWDGQTSPAVYIPLADLFGIPNLGAPDYALPALGKRGTTLWWRWPMPYAAGARLAIVNKSNSKIDFAYGLTWRPGSTLGGLYFHACYREAPAKPGAKFTVAAIRGRGHFLGCRFGIQEAKSFHFVAVDRTIISDRETLALSGNLALDARPGDSTAALFRPEPGDMTSVGATVGDCVPFRRSLTCAMSVPSSGLPAHAVASGAAFWYQAKPGGPAKPHQPAKSGKPAKSPKRKSGKK